MPVSPMFAMNLLHMCNLVREGEKGWMFHGGRGDSSMQANLKAVELHGPLRNFFEHEKTGQSGCHPRASATSIVCWNTEEISLLCRIVIKCDSMTIRNRSTEKHWVRFRSRNSGQRLASAKYERSLMNGMTS
jgi:hypothetical protein